MHGLNDKYIARHGDIVSTAPGHQKFAPFHYLIQREVNLVVGHPWLKERNPAIESKYVMDDLNNFIKIANYEHMIPENTKIIEVPIDEHQVLAIWYLKESPVIDDAITRLNWKISTVYNQPPDKMMQMQAFYPDKIIGTHDFQECTTACRRVLPNPK
ncbi:MAG: hypothetical protein R3A44_05870 [Caldilineaceae bacterium]